MVSLEEQVKAIKEKQLKLVIAFPVYPGSIPIETAICLMKTVVELQAYEIPVTFIHIKGFGYIHIARNRLLTTFLESPDEWNRIMFIDQDVTWKAEDVVKLLYHSIKHDVVSGVYPLRQDPVRYVVNSKDLTIDEDGLMNIDGTVFGFTVISRDLLNEMLKLNGWAYYNGEPFANIIKYSFDTTNTFVGEDMSFFQQIPTKAKLDTTINLGHIGEKEFTGDLIGALNKVKENQNG